MKVVVYLARKYLKFKASDRGLSAVALIAFLTIVISGAAAVVILSVANGFHYNFKQKLMSKDSHISVIGLEYGIPDYENLVTDIEGLRGVEYAYPFFDGQALLKGHLNVWGSVIKGIPEDHYQLDEEFRSNFTVIEGAFDFSDPKSIILGENLALNLGVTIGSYVKVTVYNEDFFSLQYKFQVAGIFSAGYAEYDSTLAFISFEDAQEIYDSTGSAYGISVNVKDPFTVERYMDDIAEMCPDYYRVTWKDLNRENLSALQNEKTLMLILLSVFFVVVFFNILSTMIAMVLDKKEEIGILKAMGLKPYSTMNVFLFDGFLLGMLGSVLGVLIGLFVTISLNAILHGVEKIIDFVNYSAYYIVSPITPISYPSHFEFFKTTVYYITSFPIRIVYGDLLFIILLSVTVSTVAVIFPALTASKMRPVEVLRND